MKHLLLALLICLMAGTIILQNREMQDQRAEIQSCKEMANDLDLRLKSLYEQLESRG